MTNYLGKIIYKFQVDWFLRLARMILFLSVFREWIGKGFLWIVIAVAFIGLLVFIYKLWNKHFLELFDILGFTFLVIYAVGVLIMPFFDMLLFVFSCSLMLSMFVCMLYCKDEDAKAIAMLHVIYVFSCNLVTPCIGVSI